MGPCTSCIGGGSDPPYFVLLANGSWSCLDRLASVAAGIIDYIIDVKLCPDAPTPIPVSSQIGAWVGGIIGGGLVLGGIALGVRALVLRRRNGPYQGLDGGGFLGCLRGRRPRGQPDIELNPRPNHERQAWWNEGLEEDERIEWEVRPIPVAGLRDGYQRADPPNPPARRGRGGGHQGVPIRGRGLGDRRGGLGRSQFDRLYKQPNWYQSVPFSKRK